MGKRQKQLTWSELLATLEVQEEDLRSVTKDLLTLVSRIKQLDKDALDELSGALDEAEKGLKRGEEACRQALVLYEDIRARLWQEEAAEATTPK